MTDTTSAAGKSTEEKLPGVPASGNAAARLPQLSICMIARNEAANIGATLDSVHGWAGEVIVIDCESSDDTAAIAERSGARVVRRPNNPNLNINKNASFDLAGGTWILCLDADEIMPTELKQEIEELIARDPAENGFKIPRRNFYFGTPLMHGGNYPDKQLRLFRRGRGRFAAVHVHERIDIDGTVGDLRNPFDHHPYPTIAVWLRKFDFYTSFEASVLEAREVGLDAGSARHYMITRPLRRWLERLFLKGGIKDGVAGILAATFDLMNNVVSYGKYWEKMKNR